MKELTELIFILDRSGSMAGLEKDTIGGYNSLIEKQKGEKGRARVTTVLFDHEVEFYQDGVPLEEAGTMTEKDYFVRGSTALLDAVGRTVSHVRHVQACSEMPGKTICVITTDGMENSSREFDYETVKAMITRLQKEEGWEFLFLGANIDAAEAGGRMGIGKAEVLCCKIAATAEMPRGSSPTRAGAM